LVAGEWQETGNIEEARSLSTEEVDRSGARLAGRTRQQFDAMAGPHGAFLIGDPPMEADKMLAASEALGGVSRITFQMSSASLEREAMKRSIKLLGHEVAPIVRRKVREVRARG
jgi:hypothetical protein